MNEQKALALLGLAQRAGKIVSGDTAVGKAVKTGKAKVLLLANDASHNAKKDYRNLSAYYNVPLYEHLTRDKLGAAIGKGERVIVAVIDKGFGDSIVSALQS